MAGEKTRKNSMGKIVWGKFLRSVEYVNAHSTIGTSCVSFRGWNKQTRLKIHLLLDPLHYQKFMASNSSVKQCILRSRNYKFRDIALPDKNPVIIGRGPQTKIRDRKCSKAQSKVEIQLYKLIFTFSILEWKIYWYVYLFLLP